MTAKATETSDCEYIQCVQRGSCVLSVRLRQSEPGRSDKDKRCAAP